MDWSEKIRRRREERHLSQEELAEAVGVSRQAVSKWESGAAQPTGANPVSYTHLERKGRLVAYNL